MVTNEGEPGRSKTPRKPAVLTDLGTSIIAAVDIYADLLRMSLPHQEK